MASMLDAWRGGGAVTEAALPGWDGAWSLALIPGWEALGGRPLPELVSHQYAATTTMLLDALDALEEAKVHFVRYELLVASWPAELLRLCAFLGTPPIPPRIPFSAERVSAGEDEVAPHADVVAAAAQRVRQIAVSRGTRLAAPPRARAQETAPEAFASVVSGSFAEILHDLGASILLTTYQSGQVVFLRAPERTSLNTHYRPLRGAMGVAAGRDFLAIGAQQEVFEYRNQPRVAANLDPAGVNDAVWVPSNVHVTGDIRIHEMAFVNGELWAVNTLFSTLCTIDGRHSFVPRWRPPFVTQLAPEDRCHLNGMAVHEDRIRLVTALGEANTAGGWRAKRTDGGVIIDVETGETVLRGLSMPHSPRMHAGRWWFLESGRGALATVDLATGRYDTVIELPGFTRGLAFVGPLAFVGLSQVRESNVFSGLPIVQRKDRECGIRVVDLRSGTCVAFLRFEGMVQEIFDVQVLPGIRNPELLELHDPRVASAYVIRQKDMKDVDGT